MTTSEILSKLERYCAYQDRCTQEVLTKIKSFQVEETDTHKLIQLLKNDGFIDDERYVQSFIRGKVGIKQWGKQKIRISLLQKGINEELIDKYLEDITPQQYTDNLQTAIRKWTQSHGKITKENIIKLYRHLMAKGYAYEDIKGEMKTEN